LNWTCGNQFNTLSKNGKVDYFNNYGVISNTTVTVFVVTKNFDCQDEKVQLKFICLSFGIIIRFGIDQNDYMNSLPFVVWLCQKVSGEMAKD
jgi:hypothetical protein